MNTGTGTMDEYEEAAVLREAFLHAERLGLPVEFLTFVVRALRRGETIGEAIWYANCEWDL